MRAKVGPKPTATPAEPAPAMKAVLDQLARTIVARELARRHKGA